MKKIMGAMTATTLIFFIVFSAGCLQEQANFSAIKQKEDGEAVEVSGFVLPSRIKAFDLCPTNYYSELCIRLSQTDEFDSDFFLEREGSKITVQGKIHRPHYEIPACDPGTTASNCYTPQDKMSIVPEKIFE